MKTPAQIENIIKLIKRNYKSTQMECAALLSTMLLSLCIFPHHAQAMQEDTGKGSLLPAPTGNRLLEIQTAVENNAVMENYNIIKTQMDLVLIRLGLTEKQFKEIHFARNNKQKSDVNYSDISASDSGFRKLPSEKSIFHQIGRGNENNEKWTNNKGEEYVFNPSTNPPKLVTNAANIGTYNYRPESDVMGHYVSDVLPYLLWGNSESDPTTFEERIRLYEKGIDEATWGVAGLEAANTLTTTDIVVDSTSSAMNLTMNRITKKLQNDGVPPQVVFSIKNRIVGGLLGPAGNIFLDYKELDDFKLRLDLISDNAQENIDVQKFRFPKDLINPQQKEERNTQNFNDDQWIKTADLAVKQRLNAEAEKNLANRNGTENVAGGRPDDLDITIDISDADRLKLLSGNYAMLYYTDLYFDSDLLHWSLGSSYYLPLRNNNSSSLTLRFPILKESIPNSDPAKSNTLIPSDRIKVHARDYGDYSYVAWGSWSNGKNTRIRHHFQDGRQSVNPTLGGYWIYGQKLELGDIPRSGSARYTGQVKGHYMSERMASDTIEMNSITGDINMNVNFRDSDFSLSGAINLDRNGEDWATARFNNQKPEGGIGFYSGYHFFIRLDVDGDRDQNPSNFMWGDFFGANAAEVGGGFGVEKGRERANGIYRAKKQ